jgi:virginiamycin B lyase
MENPNGIAPGPDGAMWFTETRRPYAAAKIGRISMQGKINEYSRGLNSQSGPSDITAGPDGRMWFVETKADETGRLTI